VGKFKLFLSCNNSWGHFLCEKKRESDLLWEFSVQTPANLEEIRERRHRLPLKSSLTLQLWTLPPQPRNSAHEEKVLKHDFMEHSSENSDIFGVRMANLGAAFAQN
jgi:hypothetical protein